eukprot:maker-scaffold311_size212931-snap-gene-1.17 protein:Tk00659 transcript:maker-scaffold311_size212931-snap-gene-1.17-mRNA-1 annotation:"na(+) h(+) exchange regulatory cofactor nhe-rf3-like"
MSSPDKYPMDDPNAIPVFISYRYVGDMTERVKYRTQEYISGPSKTCSISNSKGDATLGFDLASMTCLRGHFIDSVDADSEGEKAGLVVGDMIDKVNGKSVQNLSHQDLVDHINQVREANHSLELEVVTRRGLKKNGDI